jgi:purine-binding chemotaxis protein CheW
MSGGLVDDYLADLLGAAAAGTLGAAPPPAPATAPPSATESPAIPPPVVAPEPAVTAPANPDEISEAEFEAMLDALHGGKPPGAAASAPAAPAPAPKPAPANPDEISEDEFEALLDALHGGQPPGVATPAVAPAPAPKAAPGNPDEISEDEFEALLDALHGGQPPGVATPAVALPPQGLTAPGAAVATAQEIRAAEEREAEAESWRGQERRASRRSSRWLRLRVHQQDYAVELLKVQEVLLPVGVLPMRDTDAAILGVMNLRGVVVPVLDLGLWLGLEEIEDSPQSRYVVLEQNADCIALKVSAVLDVHAIADGQVEPAEHTLAPPGAGMLQGVTRLNSQPVILLDAAGLLG